MMNWPCAMLMTPATPKMMASPDAAITNIPFALSGRCRAGERRVPRTTAARRASSSSEIHRPGTVLLLAPGLLQPLEHVLVGEVAVLIGVQVIDPRIGTDALLRGPDDVELAVVAGLADAGPEMGVVVLLVDLHRALRRREFLARQSFVDQGVGVGARLLDRLGEQIGLEVGRLHDRVGDVLVAELRLVALDEGLVLRRID